MGKTIILSFPPKVDREEKVRLIESVNNQLASVHSDVQSWNGFVELRERENNGYHFIAKCDDEIVRNKMQNLLDTLPLP